MNTLVGPQTAYRFEGVEATTHALWPEASATTFSLEELQQTLDNEFVHASEPPTADRMEQLASAISAPEQLERVVTETIGDRHRLKEVAAASEKHPLGFYKIPLLWENGKYQLRTNIWPDGPGAPDGEDIHSHKFDFASAVLLGHIATWLYEFTDEGPVRYGTIPMAEAALKTDPREAQRSLDWHWRQIDRMCRDLPEEHIPKPVMLFEGSGATGGAHEALTFKGESYARLLTNNTILGPKSVYSLMHTARHTAFQLSPKEKLATLFLRGATLPTPDVIGRRPSEQQQSADVFTPKVRLSRREVARELTSLLNGLWRIS